MSFKAISFIEKGQYKEITYVWEKEGVKTFKTHLFPLAVYEFFRPEKLYIFVTEEAKTAKRKDAEKTYIEEIKDFFKSTSKNNFSYEFVNIPKGTNFLFKMSDF